MKNFKIFLIISGLFSITAFSSCSRQLHFQTSQVVPAAEGSAKITKDANSNYVINIKINHLAEPERLQPKRSVYVAWMETKDNGIKNLGQLKSSSGLFSNALQGELMTVTPFYPTRVFITAEDQANIQHPGSITVLTTQESN